MNYTNAATIENHENDIPVAGVMHRIDNENAESWADDERDSFPGFSGLMGNSSAFRRVLREVEMVAGTDATVLLCGETGSGKELIARAIHEHSARHFAPLVKLNCAAIPTGLLESELFGHEKGAFTGAISSRIGRFELANRGTMFLDEIGEIPLELQPKLLRVLQEREFERLGNSRTLQADTRVIAATIRDLEKMVEEQRFRADLFYRLNVFPIRIPSLRERPDDIPLLVRHFVHECARRMKKQIDTISSVSMNALRQHPWPGNIRELQNVIERAVIMTKGAELQVQVSALKMRAPSNFERLPTAALDQTLELQEKEIIEAALSECAGRVSGPDGAATKLGIPRPTLDSRIKRLGINKYQFRVQVSH